MGIYRQAAAKRRRARQPDTEFLLLLARQTDLLPLLTEYVQQGGRVVLDLPGAWYDEWMRVFPTGKGSAFAKLFGALLDDFQYSGVNRTLKIGDDVLNGFVAAITPTSAKTLASYDDGKPAILENRLGKGSAVILGYEAAQSCFKPGNADNERRLLPYALDKRTSPYACDGAIVYRLASPNADHYFLLNDGPAKTVRLDTKALRYRQLSDAVTGKVLTLGGESKLAAHDARWLRFAK